MARQQLGTKPRFYIDFYSFQKMSGRITNIVSKRITGRINNGVIENFYGRHWPANIQGRMSYKDELHTITDIHPSNYICVNTGDGVNPLDGDIMNTQSTWGYYVPTGMSGSDGGDKPIVKDFNFCAVLGHNFKTAEVDMFPQLLTHDHYQSSGSGSAWIDMTLRQEYVSEIINYKLCLDK